MASSFSDYVNDRMRQHLADFSTVFEFSIRRHSSTAARNFDAGVFHRLLSNSPKHDLPSSKSNMYEIRPRTLTCVETERFDLMKIRRVMQHLGMASWAREATWFPTEVCASVNSADVQATS
jgi:endonuclease/exonuclease/phosphatase family metal-dependent hydrolase